MIKKILIKIYTILNYFFKTLNRKPKLDLIPNERDDRDYMLDLEDEKIKDSDLGQYVTEVKNQGSAGSCCSHACLSWYEVFVNKDNPKLLKDKTFSKGFSERFHYYYARKSNGIYPKLGGMSIRTGFKIMSKKGMAPDILCPYSIPKLNDEPSQFSQSFAKFFNIKEYYNLYNLKQVILALQQGYPVVCGIKVFRSFFSTPTNGMVPMPEQGERYYGGHAILILGYNKKLNKFKFLNSWGRNWGKRGFGYLDYDYLLNYGFDFFTGNIKKQDVI